MATTTETDVFQGIEESKGNTKLPSLPEGVFKARVDCVKKVQSTKDQSEVYTIAEFTILESTVPTMPPGTRASRVIGMKPKPKVGTKYSLAEVKNLFGAILNESQDAVTSQTANAIVSPKNPAAGRVITIMAKNKPDSQFTNYTYSAAT